MGKYMKKSKMGGEVAVMEVSSSSSAPPMGVRTRAKTLALQKSSPPSPSPPPSSPAAPSFDYIQLRSRRLQKVLVRPKNQPPAKQSGFCGGAAAAVSSRTLTEQKRVPVDSDENAEFSFGENTLETEARDSHNSGCPEPPPIDEGALWTRFAGGCKRGRIYGMGVVPSHQYPPLFPDNDDADTASGSVDLREQVTLLNREIFQKAEAHAWRVAAVQAACAEKLRILEFTVQTQSQQVSDLRKAYTDMYSFLTQMRSGGSASVTLPDLPPPPPPPPPPPLP